MKNLIAILPFLVILVSCTPTSQPVEYGQDECAHCKMSIVEAPFAAELVTKKGKVFKFDAIECMLAYLQEHSEEDFAMYLVHDFAAPEKWHDATNCKYLISKGIPSPMGGFLSAYSIETNASNMQASKGGQVYDWPELVIAFKK